MKSENNFGKCIEFNVVLLGCSYVETKEQMEDYYTLFSAKQPSFSSFSMQWKYPTSFRKIDLCTLRYPKKGIIVGQCVKKDGKYLPADEESQAYLLVRKTHTFWKVATEMNKIELVPKNSNYTIL